MKCGCKKSGSTGTCDVCNRPSDNDEYDYVIVGLGTSGAPLARYLSEDMKTSVLVLESGENRGTDPVILKGGPFGGAVPPGSTYGLFGAPTHTILRAANVANINLGQSEIYGLPEGKMWGGSSGHNVLNAVFSSPDIYDDYWAPVNPRWSFNNILPFLKFLETYTPVASPLNPATRGTSGPLFVTQDPPVAGPYYTAVTAATNAPPVADINDPSTGDVGVSAPQWYFTPDRLFRSWAQSAFLPLSVVTPDGRGVGGRKLRILSNALATKVIIGKERSGLVAKGVQYFYGDLPNELRTVRARKKVFLCAGTISTPQLLELSGIGDPAVLGPLGIPVLVANANVGKHMQNHYGPNAALPRGNVPPPAFQSIVHIDGSGANIAQPNDGVRRVQLRNAGSLYPQLVGTLGFAPADLIQMLSFMLRTNHLGTTHIVSRNATTAPEILFNYYKDTGPGSDLDQAVDIYRVFANISIALTGQLPVYPIPAHYPLAEYGAFGGLAPSDALLRTDAINAQLVGVFHQTGSARMATTAAEGVVDGNLDVFGVRNLSCCDCSIQPEITTSNTAHPAYLTGLIKAKIEGAIGLP